MRNLLNKVVFLMMFTILFVNVQPLVFPAEFSLGDTVEVCNTLGLGLFVRSAPAGVVVGGKFDGDRGMVIDGPQTASYEGVDYTWWKVRWGSDALEGWSAAGYPGGVDYLEKVDLVRSTKFSIGDFVKVDGAGVSGLAVRTDPPALFWDTSAEEDAAGKIVGGPFYGVANGMPGFCSFWKVDYGIDLGWSAEDYLIETTVPRMSVNPASIVNESILPGDLITLAVNVTDIPQNHGTCGIQFRLEWDSAVLNGVSMWLPTGHFMDSLGTAESEANLWKFVLRRGTGYAEYAVTFYDLSLAIAQGYAPRYGSGILASITLRVVSTGSTAITLKETIIGDRNAKPIIHSAENGMFGKKPSKFRAGDRVRTTDNLNVREGPGLGYGIIDTMANGTLGQIVGGPAGADDYDWWEVNYETGIRGWSAENWLEVVQAPVCGKPVLVSRLEISPQGDHVVGDTLVAKFEIQNQGDAAITLDKWLVGGRFNGGMMSNGRFPDFDPRVAVSVTLQPNETRVWFGSLKLIEAGDYAFFVAYYIENPTEAEKKLLDENNWNTCISLAEGLRDEDREEDITVEGLPRISFPLSDTTQKFFVSHWSGKIRNVDFTDGRLEYYPGDTVEIHVEMENTGLGLNKYSIELFILDPNGEIVHSEERSSEEYLGEGENLAYGPFEYTLPKKSQPWEEDAISGEYCVLAKLRARLAGAFPEPTLVVDYYGLGEELAPPRVIFRVGEDGDNYDYREGEDFKKLQDEIRNWRKTVFPVCLNMPDYLGDPTERASIILTIDPLRERPIKEGEYQRVTLEATITEKAKQILDEIAPGYGIGIDLYVSTPATFGGSAQTYVARLVASIAESVLDKEKLVKDVSQAILTKALEKGLEMPELGTVMKLVDAFGPGLTGEYETTVETRTHLGEHDLYLPVNTPLTLTISGAIYVYPRNMPFFSPIFETKLYCLEAQQEVLIPEDQNEGAIGVVGVQLGLSMSEDDLKDLLRDYTVARMASPAEIRAYDSQDRITGLLNGEVREGIPNSTYDDASEAITIFNSTDIYRFESAGTDRGTYGMVVFRVMEGETRIFNVTEIPSSADAVHLYSIDWGALSRGEKGVTVMVDSDGDNAFEHTFTSGSELTHFPGDVGMDGQVNILDVIVAANAFGSRVGEDRWNKVFDENGDGRISVLDLILIARQFGKRYV